MHDNAFFRVKNNATDADPSVAKDGCQNRKMGTTEGERSGSQFRSLFRSR